MFRETLQQCEAARPLAPIIDAYEKRRGEITGFFYDDDGKPKINLCIQREICPVCGSSNLNRAPVYAGWPMNECGDCFGHFVELMPKDSALADFFDFSVGERDFVTNVLHKKAHARNHMVTAPRVIAINEICPQGGRILDVGCGAGDFLASLDKSVWESTGVDLSETAVQISAERGVDHTIRGTVFDIALSESFDCITFFGVLCRLDNHLNVFRHSAKLLKPGGRIVIADINHNSWFSRLVGQSTSKLVPPLHPILMSFQSLETSLSNAGLRVILGSTPGRFDTVEAYRQAKSGRISGMPDAVLELLDMEYASDSMALQELLVENRQSEHLWITAQRTQDEA
jgi:SAM-dependent methyltransferase